MLIADLHIHSRYSRATSSQCTPEHLDLWARRKGIYLLGTGDFTHPAWREELKEKLVPSEEGLYVLREDLRTRDICLGAPRFVISGEISSIYKKNDRVRKVHNLILLPSFEDAQVLSQKLETIGNIHSDGRPILGLDSRDLLEITLDICPRAVFIPAHIWTPHFSLFGAFSGFDTIEECFEDLTPQIHALETGLSSDPAMNWQLSALDRYTLVSNSDAHSPAKLGREANILNIDLSYSALSRAIEKGKSGGFVGTIEFFPEEGKYHLDGHRKCGVCLSPQETQALEGRCPVCGKKLTIGVQHRVEQLADRSAGYVPADAPIFESLAPLPEVLAASTGRSPSSTKTLQQYEQLLKTLGPEFHILRDLSLSDIEQAAGPCVAEGIRRLRRGEVIRKPGYDGEYGVIQILDASEVQALSGQLSFFEASPLKRAPQKTDAIQTIKTRQKASFAPEPETAAPPEMPNKNQELAIAASERVVCVVAGPGTGKTKTLISRIAHLIENCGVHPSEITAVTFTNKAAKELKQRLQARFGNKRIANAITIGTFHSICLKMLLEKRPCVLASDYETQDIAQIVCEELGLTRSARQLLNDISQIKNQDLKELPVSMQEPFALYQGKLKKLGAMDFDDLLLNVLHNSGDFQLRGFSHLLIDEFQDINDLQYRLIKELGKNSQSIFAIGDPDQSIYGFRGSNPKCFEKLHQDFSDVREIRLTENYRSSPEILSCALPVISRNPGPPRRLTAHKSQGALVRLVKADSDLAEGIFVAKEIGRMVGGMDMLDAQREGFSELKQRDFSDIAILYRTHRQAEILENCLKKESIPYLVTGREDFLADRAVRGAVCFFRFLLNPDDQLSLRSSLHLAFDCPEQPIQTLLSRWEGFPSENKLSRLSEICGDLLSTPQIREWSDYISQYLSDISKKRADLILSRWAQQRKLEGSPAFKRFIGMALLERRMSDLLDTLLLGQERDLERAINKRYSSGAVTLMTLHGSKGLEFPVVFLCGVNEGTLPLVSPLHPTDLDEERRLLFVGMTRAKEELLILSSKSPSPFLEDLPSRFVSSSKANANKAVKQLSLFDL